MVPERDLFLNTQKVRDCSWSSYLRPFSKFESFEIKRVDIGQNDSSIQVSDGVRTYGNFLLHFRSRHQSKPHLYIILCRSYSKSHSFGPTLITECKRPTHWNLFSGLDGKIKGYRNLIPIIMDGTSEQDPQIPLVRKLSKS